MKIKYFGISPSNVQLAKRKLENRSIKDLEILRLLCENLNCKCKLHIFRPKSQIKYIPSTFIKQVHSTAVQETRGRLHSQTTLTSF